ncbi:MAG TPA: hypothetical protein VF824_12110 [Thermoanaerobaculia bacterium]|jgi:hypothetical protein
MTVLLAAAVVLTIALAIRFAVTQARAQTLLRRAHPDEPWLWRHDWADHRVRETALVPLAFLWSFAALWSLVCAAIYFAGRRGNFFSPFQWLFPLFGAMLLLLVGYHTLRRVKYGRSFCRVDRVPVSLGSTLRGEVQARVGELPQEGFRVRLSCMRIVVRRSGGKRSTDEDLLWQDEQLVPSAAVMRSPVGVRIPIRLDVPGDQEPSDESDRSNRVVWRLEVFADVPGIDYAARFELPVFRTSEAGVLEPFSPGRVDASQWTPPPSVRIAPAPSGDVITVVSPAGLGDRVFSIAFLAIWYGVLYVMYRVGAPLFFVIVFALFGLIVVVMLFDFLFGRSVVRASRNSLSFERRTLFVRRACTLLPAHVETLEPQMGFRSGAKAYFDVVARLRDGRTIHIAKNFPRRRDAEVVAGRVWRLLEKRA